MEKKEVREVKGICFHDSYSNCENIDKELYVCGKYDCYKYKCPGTKYDRDGTRTPITLKSISYFFKEILR